MERKTKVALIVLLCILIGVVILVIVFFGGFTEKNCAKRYILDELGGEIVECTTEGEAQVCHLVYKEDNRVIGEIWIYCFPGGIEKYKGYTLKAEGEQMIDYDQGLIILKGTLDFRRKACSLYEEKFGFHCGIFERR